jgi:hypothetical protein
MKKEERDERDRKRKIRRERWMETEGATLD